MNTTINDLIIVSKSPWHPTIRREHAVARLAVASGYRVTFIEPPADIRTLRKSPRQWSAGIGSQLSEWTPEGIRVIRRSCLASPHRHPVAEILERLQLRWILSRAMSSEPTAVVVTLPWHLAAVPLRSKDRTVLDVADDWAALMPARADRIRSLYRSGVADVDHIILVSEHLRGLFDNRQQCTVVRNGVDSDLLKAEPGAEQVPGRMVYVGTLSERFDADVVGGLLDELPAHTLELYGACAYAGHGDRPGCDLRRLLERSDQRARWNGTISRSGLAGVLDAAELLLVPNRDRSRGQDSMKIYDYAARGRPILVTAASVEGISEMPPHTYAARNSQDLAALALQARGEPIEFCRDRQRWAARHSWESRWVNLEPLIFEPRNGAPEMDLEIV